MYLYNFILAIRPNIENNPKGILIIQISKVSLINNDSSNAIENDHNIMTCTMKNIKDITIKQLNFCSVAVFLF